MADIYELIRKQAELRLIAKHKKKMIEVAETEWRDAHTAAEAASQAVFAEWDRIAGGESYDKA